MGRAAHGFSKCYAGRNVENTERTRATTIDCNPIEKRPSDRPNREDYVRDGEAWRVFVLAAEVLEEPVKGEKRTREYKKKIKIKNTIIRFDILWFVIIKRRFNCEMKSGYKW